MPADQELRKMSFTGVVDDNIGTKTALTSGYNVIWTSGDQISVFANGNNSQFTASNIRASESGLEGGVATFEGMATAADVYYGVYPYNESATISETIVSTVLPTDQTAVAGSFAVGSNISVAKAAEEDVLQFRNAGAIVGLTVNGEGISAIRLQSADGTAAMSGAVTVDVSGDTPVMAMASGAVNHVRIVAAQPSDDNTDATGTLTSGETYYFVVAPGEYSGLQLVFENAGLDATYTTSTAEVVTVERNGNKNLGFFVAELRDSNGVPSKPFPLGVRVTSTYSLPRMYSFGSDRTAFIFTPDGRVENAGAISASLAFSSEAPSFSINVDADGTVKVREN